MRETRKINTAVSPVLENRGTRNGRSWLFSVSCAVMLVFALALGSTPKLHAQLTGTISGTV